MWHNLNRYCCITIVVLKGTKLSGECKSRVVILQVVPRPDLVEMHDVAATDPLLLIHLKVSNKITVFVCVSTRMHVSKCMYEHVYMCVLLVCVVYAFTHTSLHFSPQGILCRFHVTGALRESIYKGREELRSHPSDCLTSSKPLE